MSEEQGDNETENPQSQKTSSEDGKSQLPETVIPEEVQAYLNDMPEPQRKAVEAIMVGMSVKRRFRGPLPSPEMLKEYEQALPGCAERIVSQFEKQAQHRMDMEKKVIPEDQRQSSVGQIFGFILALTFLLVAGILIYYDHDTAGTILGTVDLVALVSIFVIGKYHQRREDQDK